MAARRLIEGVELLQLFDAITPSLIRYPSIDPGTFRDKVEQVVKELTSG